MKKLNKKILFPILLISSLALSSCNSSEVGEDGDDVAPVITLSSPAGGDELAGQSVITWQTTEENPSTVEIRLSNDSGANFDIYVANTPDTGTYSWDTTTYPDSSEYRIRIVAQDIVGNKSTPVESTSDFSINNVPHLIGFGRFNDKNFNGYADLGDTLELRFDTPVTGSAVGADFRLPVTGNTLGSGASSSPGGTPNELVINLGNNPYIRTRQKFTQAMVGNGDPNLPSSIDILSPIATLVNPVTGFSAAPSSQFIDIIPGLGSEQLTVDYDLDVQADTVFGNHIAIDAGDVTGDGRPDLVGISEEAGTANYLLWIRVSDPYTAFAERTYTRPLGSVRPTVVKLVDVNRDGWLDVFIGMSSGASQLRLHVGSKTIQPYSFSSATVGNGNVLALAAGNIDRDADNDFLISIEGAGTYYLDSNGIGGFSFAPILFSATPATKLDLADVDGDGDKDAILFHSSGHTIWKNNGIGSFSLFQTIGGTDVRAAAMGDLDDDGDVDMVFANSNGTVQILSNNSNGSFTSTSSLVVSGTVTSVAMFNLDGDRLKEIAFSVDGENDKVFVNNGGLNFSDSTILMDGIGGDVQTLAFVSTDYNNDGDDDLVTLGLLPASIGVWHGALSGTWGMLEFVEGTAPEPSGLSWRVSGTADVNKDTFPDVIMSQGSNSEIYFGDGAGGFTFSQAFTNNSPVGVEPANCQKLADLDRDGDIDLVLGQHIYINDGTGNLTYSGLAQHTLGAGFAIETVDLNRDGRLEILFGGLNGIDVYSNNGLQNATLGFTFSYNIPLINLVGVLRSGDLNRDGHADLVFSGNGEGLNYLQNNGAGGFLAPAPVGSFSSVAYIQLGDVDNNGRLDIMASENEFNGLDAQVWMQTSYSSVNFSNQLTAYGAGSAMADIDSDGDLDYFVRGTSGENNPGGMPTELYLNNGDGTHPGSAVLLPSKKDAVGLIIFTDFDRDGDLDMLDWDKLLISK